MTRRRRAIEQRVEALESINGVRNAFLEYDESGFAPGHRWCICANTRTGSKEYLCINLAECEQAVESLEHLCREEGRLTDAQCRAIIDRALAGIGGATS